MKSGWCRPCFGLDTLTPHLIQSFTVSQAKPVSQNLINLLCWFLIEGEQQSIILYNQPYNM